MQSVCVCRLKLLKIYRKRENGKTRSDNTADMNSSEKWFCSSRRKEIKKQKQNRNFGNLSIAISRKQHSSNHNNKEEKRNTFTQNSIHDNNNNCGIRCTESVNINRNSQNAREKKYDLEY